MNSRFVHISGITLKYVRRWVENIGAGLPSWSYTTFNHWIGHEYAFFPNPEFSSVNESNAVSIAFMTSKAFAYSDILTGFACQNCSLCSVEIYKYRLFSPFNAQLLHPNQDKAFVCLFCFRFESSFWLLHPLQVYNFVLSTYMFSPQIGTKQCNNFYFFIFWLCDHSADCEHSK